MKKIKFLFIISLMILLVSIGSISAEDTDSSNIQAIGSNMQNDILLNDVIENDISNNNLASDYESNENGALISESSNEDDNLNDDLNDEINSDDSQIAENIKVNFSHRVYKDDIGNITVVLPEEAKGYLAVAIDEVIIYNETISEKSVQIPIVIPKPKFPYG